MTTITSTALASTATSTTAASSSLTASRSTTTTATTTTASIVPASCVTNAPVASRVDCGFAGITPDGCTSRQCCWAPLPVGTSGPWCYSIVS